ncbi:tRNA lysidine(34) synthetase TilS [Phenylobacterium sp.]|uniref:tRNA lysidine(34) synthetase TilS n=1 Tax=Phenylobacterium sp. TaxID=1871053 RepID=UPI0025F98AA9|nr:tRNA lysidine(34) synthetase TilS [Phenylobacterium sp.]MCA3740224.1 tRNA lysidine(34) synthetase TilS [Phenylobacterium sp.]
MRGLSPPIEVEVKARLDARLDADARSPLAVALSGGGDSLALTLMAARWAKAHSRPLLVLTVDHGLQPDSAAWTQACAWAADRIGARFRGLTWTDPRPSGGLPAAARAARHRLLAQAAREAGARIILLGHTLDDIAEARAMRAAGSTTPSPREWAPSPAWPEGLDVFLLRPLLGIRREALREWLRARGETWIEDPANTNLRFARSRARAALAEPGGTDPEACAPGTAPTPLADLALQVVARPFGLQIARQALREADPAAARRFVAAACLSAAGGVRPPRGGALDRLVERLAGPEAVRATLAGALVLSDAGGVTFGRTAGEMRRQGVEDLWLPAGGEGIFDGRFRIETTSPARIRPLEGRLSRLSTADRAALSSVPPALRGGLPGVETGSAFHPAGTPGSGVRVQPLAHIRLLGACGAVADEAAAARLSPELSR